MKHIVLQGRLTGDPEQKTTQSGANLCTFSIAVNEKYGEQEHVDFFRCVAWNKTAEFVGKFFHKGRLILLSGTPRMERFADKDGNNREAFKVIVNRVYFTGEPRQEGGGGQSSGGGGYGGHRGGVSQAQAAGHGAPPAAGGDNFGDMEDVPF